MNKKLMWLVTGIVVLAFSLRLINLGSFMTADEENWMIRSSHFYHNIFRNKDTGGAFMTTHPGATAMWLIGGGEIIQEKLLGYDVDESNLKDFRMSATLPIALVSSLLIGMIVYLLFRLFGVGAAFWGGLLLALDPYLLGMSQIAHLDALQSLFMLCSVLAFLTGLQKGPIQLYVISGLFAGLAMGTKVLPALWLFVFFAIVAFVHYWRGKKIDWRETIRITSFVFGVAMLTFYVAWPALWFTDDIGRSYVKDVPVIIEDSHIELEVSQEPIEPITFYGRTILGRTTPFVLVLALSAIVVVVASSFKQRRVHPIVWFFLYAAGYVVLITLIAKKGDRYALPALVALIVIAGWAVVPLIRGIKGVRSILTPLRQLAESPLIRGAIIAVLLLSQTLLSFPYAIAYNSPLFDVRPSSQKGWGEGLDEAAAWLNQHPFISNLVIASWYPGVTGTYFKGRTMSLSSREDQRVGFVVTYRNMYGRAQDDIASDVLDEFRGKDPAHIIYVQGKPYVWIYNTLGPRYFRQHVGELVPSVEVGQVVPISFEGWNRIDFAMATFSGRNNTEDVVVHIRENIDSTEDARTIRVNARTILDSDWQAFTFEPIQDSAGKTYYVTLTSPTSSEGNAVTVRYAKEDVLPGQMMFNGALRDGDVGYRLVR